MNSKLSQKIVLLCALVALFFNVDTLRAEITSVEAFPNISFSSPVDLQNANDETNRLFVVEQSGLIRVFENNANVSSSSVFLNITDRVQFDGEQGLLGLAFHPNFKSNGYLFVHYTRKPDGASVITRFQSVNSSVDSSTELILMTIPQPYTNHNGGGLAFGPDGFLYIALGDGGSAGDPENRAQNRRQLLGKILRINVDSTSRGKNYSIPAGNPYARGSQKFKKEIYAYGFRNPWRISFDSLTGNLWTGDVGQDKFEEVDIVKKGGNYGWRLFEGRGKFTCPAAICNTTGHTRPVYVYSHDIGQSITGGFVYRGSLLPQLVGKYIFGDFISGKIFALEKSGKRYTASELGGPAYMVSTFGLDESGEIYFCDYVSGKIYKFNS